MVAQRRTLMGRLVVLLAGATAGAVALAGPSAARAAPARAAIEMLTVLATACAAGLLWRRAKAGGHGRDLLLACAAAAFAVAEIAFSLLPTLVSQQTDGGVLNADAVARLLVAAVLATAALIPARLADRAQRRTLSALGAGLVAVGLALFAGASPPAAYVAAALLAAVAGAAFAWRAPRDGAWLGGAAVLLAGAHLDAGLGPVLAPDWITAGDVLRCAAALVLVAGVLRHPGAYLSRAARRAVAEERRRIARDLHDGLAQELAYIAAHAPRVAARGDDRAAAAIAEAAARALDESRLVIASLTRPPGEPLGPALARAAERIVARAGMAMRVDLQADVEVEQAVRSDLLRIVTEATTNAVRHSGASEVSLTFIEEEALVLRIADDGVGFRPDDTDQQPYSGFGLTSMQERAERAGGRLRVRSDPERGTVVEVRFA